MQAKFVRCSGNRQFPLGAAALQTLHAQAKPPAYALAEVTVKDEAGYKNDFLPKIQPVIKENGGVYLASRLQQDLKLRCGQGPPNPVVLIRYDSMAAFKKYAEESNKIIKEDGAKYAAFRAYYAIEGIEQK